MFSHLRSSRLCAVLLAASSIAWAGRVAAADVANDGWYTADQANRGHQDFNNRCAECHRPDLTGGPDVYMLATNDLFWLWGWTFLALIAVVWFARSPFTTAGAHSASD